MKMTFEELAKLASDTDLQLWGKKRLDHLLKHLKQEVDELVAESDQLDPAMFPNGTDPKKRFEFKKEFGDVLFCLVSLAYQFDVDINEALALTITKLQERLKYGVK